mmetsp:Transcript_27595/g.38388  ORF Transcript_27595/g.38388 Transcript_27595/m.38388 type:complete len:210 (+) Transcript_27595:52-681(+)|eukprot:CAMPEP_0201489118 /NCGR_PEP_ID=MMETSP0151_2-20130828/21034_1 /ASSEMBLY_ACC=CAM_ASM_000257 /TAXON_ID=200890 /ORGANISM="Paramoeba atlantica, Strain 621/1 / CCAP 1560/9" /LENGTH=209 /DNA_ID=CAMNT_0047874601 /DNA_START=52 /DNA_END=681 /DNA_ORIENTATION=-
MAEERHAVVCTCGKTEVTVGKVRYRGLCCCIDCDGAHQWAATKGGPQHTDIGSDSWYFENDILISKGEENIQFFNLEKGYPTIRLVTKCCYSTLMGSHPVYQKNVVIVYGRRLKDKPDFEQRFCIFTDDFSDEKKAKLPSADSFQDGWFETVGEGDPPKFLVAFSKCSTPPCTTSNGKKLEDLIGEKGVTSLNFVPPNGKITPFRAKVE